MNPTGERRLYRLRDLAFAQSGTKMTYAVIALAAGLCLTTGGLVWFGYVATREWRHGTELLLERRQEEGVALATAALERDMKGAAAFLLISANTAMIEPDPPYDFMRTTASTFARFPYSESVVVWRRSADSGGKTYVLNRAERRPAWESGGEDTDAYPVRLRTDPPELKDLVSTIQQQRLAGRSFAVSQVTLGGAPYQVVTHALLAPTPPFDLSAFVAFTVNLDWVRDEYFGPVLNQAATIGGTADILSYSVNDNAGQRVATTGILSAGASTIRRTFPLLFIDQTILKLPRREMDRFAIWSVTVGPTDDNTDASATTATRRTFALLAISAVASIGALLVTLRAVEAKAALTTMKSDFVSAVTHELKTPVAIIRLVGDTLSTGRYTTPEAVGEYARVLSHEATRLGKSIDQLLTYARYSEAQRNEAPEFSRLDLRELMDTALENLTFALTAARATLTLDVPDGLPPIAVDRLAIKHVFENIVDNAIKYSAGEPKIHVSARVTGKHISMTVTDQGIGIPREDLEHVFDRFYRGGNVNTGGSGLGLTIVRRILEYHGGQIKIRSTVNVGTEVELLLPIAIPS